MPVVFTDAWVGSLADPIETPILDDEGKPYVGGVWTLMPVSQAKRREWQKRFHFCPRCAGLGFLPLPGGKAAKCPFCGGREDQPSFNNAEIRKEVFKEVVLGWRDWQTASGKDIPFTDPLRDRLADEAQDVFITVLDNAESAYRKRSTDLEKG